MKTWSLRFIFVAVVSLIPGALAAQPQSAVIRGRVAGADRQPVAGAVVTLLDRLGSPIAATQTEADGSFQLENVPPGTYTLLAEAPPQRSDARVVAVQTPLPIDVQLTLAAHVAESVIVQGTAEAQVTTRMTIAGDAIRQLPTRMPSRGVQQVLATLPGWGSEDNGLLHVRGVDDGVLYVEDGLPVYDRMDALFGIAPDPASIGSLNVLTGYIPPEYGLKSGAVIEVQSSTTPRTEWVGTVDTGIGSDAVRSLRGFGGGPVGGRANLGVSVTSDRSDRFLDPVHPDNLHNEGNVLSSEVHLNVLATDANLVKVDVTGGRSRYEVPHGEAQEDAGQDQRQRVVQHSQSASWQRAWSDAAVSRLAAYRRHVDADLLGSPGDLPLSARSDRQQARTGLIAGLTYERRRHTLKFGFEVGHLTLREDFSFAVTNPQKAEAAGISERAAEFGVANPFRFADQANRGQWSFYAQDRVRGTDRFTVDFGLRFNRTHLLIPASQWSPRVGVAYAWPGATTTLRASLNRFFQPPQPEHLLLASSAGARALSPFAAEASSGNSGGANLEPERQTAWEVGIDRWFAGAIRLDTALWSRHVAQLRGPERLFWHDNHLSEQRGERYRARLGFTRRGTQVSRLVVVCQLHTVESGAGWPDQRRTLPGREHSLEISAGTRFTPDHDQRHLGAAGLIYQSGGRGFSASVAARYKSGTPLEVDDDDIADLTKRPGAELVDSEKGRVRARTVFDLSLSQTLHRGRRIDTSVRISVLNLANHAFALNFGNPFSGTHFGAPRTLRADLRIGLR